MHSQKKEELLVQLDNALKRKVEEKYKKQLRTQEIVSPQSSKLSEQEKMKVNTRYEQQPSNRPIHTSRSPLIHSNKEIETMPNKSGQNNFNKNKLGLSPNLVSKANTEREVTYTPNVEETRDSQLKEQIKKLKGRNIMLQRELRQLKETIQQLENESKILKRQQSEFSTLKNQNNSLVKEIEYLRSRPVLKQTSKAPQMQYIEQQIKKILTILNCSFIHKQVKAQSFISEAFRSISIEINKLIEDKSKISNKLNTFDIQNLMAKQSSSMFKKEVDILREQNEQLQDLIQDNCLRIEELQQQSQYYEQQKKNLQGRYRQVIKQLQGIKKEFKYTIQASRSSRPKIQKPCFISREGLTDSTVVKFSNEVDVQTDEVVIESYQFQQKIQQKPLKQQIQQDQNKQVKNQQMTYIAKLQQSNLQNDIHRSELQQQIIRMQQQIEQLNKRCDRYRKEVVQLTNQLKNQQQTKEQLMYQNAKKDQDCIKKMKSINQLRNQLDECIEKLEIVNLNLKTEQTEKTMILQQRSNALNEVQRLKKKIHQYEEKNKILQKQFYAERQEFEHQILKKTNNMEQSWNKQQSSLLSQLKSKQNKLRQIQNEFQTKNTLLTSKIRQLQSENRNYKQKFSRIQEIQLQFVQLRNTLTQKLNEVFNHQKDRDSLISEYQKKIKTFEERIRDFDLQTNKINECTKYLQKSNKQLIQQTKKYQQNENSLLQKIDGMSRQIFAYKCDVQRLSFDSKNNAQLKEYFQQVSNELKSKLEQLLLQMAKTENEKAQIIAKKLEIENKNQEISMKENEIVYALEQTKRENSVLKVNLEHISSSYRQLQSQLLRKQEQMRQLDRARTEQIAFQTFDIERLMKQIKELRAKLQQMNSLRESKNYQSSESQQKIIMLTEQNRSLIRQHQMLLQQIHIKQTNKQEDIYLNQLKSKQYCMLIKKILITNQENNDLINCDNFQELLQIGAERIVARKKYQRDEESNNRKTKINDYQYEINQPTKRYYIGTEISSSQEIFQPKTFGIGEQFLRTQSNITKTQRALESPRQFRFSLSPFDEKQKQKRTQRIISYFDPNQSNESKTKSKVQQEKGSQF